MLTVLTLSQVVPPQPLLGHTTEDISTGGKCVGSTIMATSSVIPRNQQISDNFINSSVRFQCVLRIWVRFLMTDVLIGMSKSFEVSFKWLFTTSSVVLHYQPSQWLNDSTTENKFSLFFALISESLKRSDLHFL